MRRGEDPAAEEADAAPLAVVLFACGFLGTHLLEALADGAHALRAGDLGAACGEDDAREGLQPSLVRGLGVPLAPMRLEAEALADLLEDARYAFVVRGPGPRPAGEDEALLEVLPEALAAAGGVGRLVVVEARPARAATAAALVAAAVEAGQEAVGLVLSGLYGPRAAERDEPGGSLLALARGRRGLLPRGPFGLHVADAARAAAHLARSDAASGSLHSLGPGARLEGRALARLVADLAGRPSPRAARLSGPLADALRAARRALVGSGRAARPGEVAAEDPPALAALGFHPERADVEEGVRETLAWYKHEGWLADA